MGDSSVAGLRGALEFPVPFSQPDQRLDSLLRHLGSLDLDVRDGSAGGAEIDSVDAMVSEALRNEVARAGFPRTAHISKEARSSLLAMVWHDARRDSARWAYWTPRLRAAVTSGDLRPREYAEIVDAYAVRYRRTRQVFNTQLGEGHAALDATAVAESRLRLGLLPSGWGVEEVMAYCRCK